MLEKMKEITGAQYKAAFGVIRDYSNVWDAQVDKWHQRLAWTSEEETRESILTDPETGKEITVQEDWIVYQIIYNFTFHYVFY